MSTINVATINETMHWGKDTAQFRTWVLQRAS